MFTFLMAQQPLLGLGLLCEIPRSHSDTPHSVELLWTSDRSVAEISSWQHTRAHTHNTQKTDIPAPCEIRIRIPRKQAAVDRTATRLGHVHAYLTHTLTAGSTYSVAHNDNYVCRQNCTVPFQRYCRQFVSQRPAYSEGNCNSSELAL